jgi:hypothetical protein
MSSPGFYTRGKSGLDVSTMKKKSKIILAVVLAVILIPCILMYLRYRSNVALGHELRKEVDAWLASLPKIPESENGAPTIMKGLELLKDLPERFSEENPRIETEEDATIFRNYLAENEEALNLIEKGLSYKNWAYTTDFDKGPLRMTIPELMPFYGAAKVYSLKADLARVEGKESDAIKEYLNIVRLGNTLANERILISRMFCITILTTGLNRLLAIASSSTLAPDDLSNILSMLVKVHGNRGSAAVVFETDYYLMAMLWADMLTGVMKYDKVPPTSVEIGPNGAKTRKTTARGPDLLKFLYDFRQDVDIYKRWLEVYCTADPSKYYGLSEELKDKEALYKEIGMPKPGSWKAIFAQLAVPDSTGMIRSLVEHETIFRGTILLSAIRLYEAKNGSLPESLDALGELVPKEILIDPFSGKNLIYRREGDDFYLYSAGYNGVDDKCRDSRPIFEEGVDRESVPDIVFHAPPAPGK